MLKNNQEATSPKCCQVKEGVLLLLLCYLLSVGERKGRKTYFNLG